MFEKSVDIFILSLVLSYGNCEREGLVDKKRRGESCTAVRIFIYREGKKFGKRLGRLLRGEPLRRLRARPLPPNTTHNLETARSFGFLLDLPVPQEFKYFFCGIFESQIGKSSVWREGLTHHF